VFIFILGGVRSGKSRYAEEIALKNNKNVFYIATYENDGNDAEMTERIDKHKKHRPDEWTAVEIGKISGVCLKISEIADRTIIIDCLTLLVSNFLFDVKNADENDITKEIEKMVNEIKDGIKKNNNDVIVISNEVGQGIMPANKISRRYVDLLGRANQITAKHCDEFYFMFAGIPMMIK